MSVFFVICEDKQVMSNNLKTNIEKIIKNNSLDGSINFVTTSPQEVLDYSVRNFRGTVNAYFLDINLGANNISGLELARQIRINDAQCYIVFTTGHPELGMTAYKFHTEAFEYLLKPISFQALEECVLSIYSNYNEFTKHQKNSRDNIIRIKSGSSEYNIDRNEIIYAESMDQKVILHTANRKIEFFGYLKDIEIELNKYEKLFYRCHRSYIINLDQISEINYKDSYVIVSNGDKCFVARPHKAEIKKLLDERENIDVDSI